VDTAVVMFCSAEKLGFQAPQKLLSTGLV